MIIFDTNALNLLPPKGPRADFIRKLRQSGHHRVAVPWVVLEEMAAHQAHLYPAKYGAVLNTLEKLQAALPWTVESSLEPLDVERLLGYWRGVYGEIFEVIETSGDVARKALAREAMHLPPAKRAKDHSEGARDVAIWFSVLEFLKANPDEQVCFVTNNSSGFGDGTAYPYPMNEDVRGLEGRLALLRDFDQVVSRFSKEVSGKDVEATAGELLRSQSVRGRVAQTAMDHSSPTASVGLGAVAVEWHGWLASPEVELLSVTAVTGHEIEGDVWYTANARWLLYGLAASGPEAEARYVARVWEMKVLFSARGGKEAPTVLSDEELRLPDTADTSCMELLQRLKERVARATRKTRADVQTTVAASLSSLRAAGGQSQSVELAAAAALDRLDVASLYPTHAEVALRALGFYPTAVEQAAAALAEFDVYPSAVHRAAAALDLFGDRSAAEQVAATLAKFDVYPTAAHRAAAALSAMGGYPTAVERMASTLAKFRTADDLSEHGVPPAVPQAEGQNNPETETGDADPDGEDTDSGLGA